ncbi:MAG: hypothetical protein ACE5LU_21795 [Anaerolineae bacterium]
MTFRQSSRPCNDGIPDSQQANVTSLPNAVDGRYVTLVSPPGTNLVNVQAVGNPSPADAPAGVTFPIGFFQFTVQGIAPGGAVQVTMLLLLADRVNLNFADGQRGDDVPGADGQIIDQGAPGIRPAGAGFAAVGGYGEALSALELLAPWIILVVVVAAGAVGTVLLRRRMAQDS